MIARLLSVIAVLALCGGGAIAQTKPKLTDVGSPKTAIYIGNSFFYYNNSLHAHVLSMRRAADPQNRAAYRNTSVTISGSGFDWHDVDHYFRPNAIGRYSFDDQNNIVFNKFDKLFDVAIMMDCSQCPVHPQLGAIFTEFAKKSSDAARKNGAKPAFFMSWAYADKPEMTAQLAEAYTIAGNANDAFVIPVGARFRGVDRQAPGTQSLCARQAASEHARDLSLGGHGLCFALSRKPG